MHLLLEPGLFSSAPVQHALLIGTLVSLVSAVVGLMMVVRSQSFTGHALTDVATTGGAVSSLYSLNPFIGFLGGAFLGASAIDGIGVERARQRDVATGIVLGAATGLSALFLFLAATKTSNSGVAQQVLFGSIFTVGTSTIPLVLVVGIAVLAVMTALWRPLVLSSVSPEMAKARGVATRFIGWLFMVTLAASVGLSSLAVGSILSTALLVGPATTALRLARTLKGAILLSACLGILATSLGVILAYDSYFWDPNAQGLPVSFFIVMTVLAFFAIGSLPQLRRLRMRGVREWAGVTSV